MFSTASSSPEIDGFEELCFVGLSVDDVSATSCSLVLALFENICVRVWVVLPDVVGRSETSNKQETFSEQRWTPLKTVLKNSGDSTASGFVFLLTSCTYKNVRNMCDRLYGLNKLKT